MAKTIDVIKEKILGQVLSQDELENIMVESHYHLIEDGDFDDSEDTEVIRFTNYSSHIWVDIERDEDRSVLVTNVRRISRTEYESTRSEPFRSYEDFEKIMNHFMDKKFYHHWITAWLMTSLGRRIGDTVHLKWSDIYRKNGQYRARLTQLKEEKTGKKLAPILNALAKQKIEEYIELTGIKPMQHYDERIVITSSAAFRKQFDIAVSATKIEGKLSPHSFRKWYANTIYKLHPQDADNLMILQTLLGHSSPEITKIYINEIDKKQDKYNEDYSAYMIARGNGINMDISNSPTISVQSDDFRNLLSKLYDMGHNGEDKFESINKIICMAEQCMI